MPNDALSIYFGGATLASGFVARRCAGSRIETDGGVFRIRDDEPARELERHRIERLKSRKSK